MRVSSVCPSCARPAFSKGRSECIYCGAALQPVVTGKVTATDSGRPVEVPADALKPVPPGAAPSPGFVGEMPAWMRMDVRVNPVRRFLGSGWFVFILVAAIVVAAILVIATTIDNHQPPGWNPPPAGR
jgi:hypothetical protein